MNTLYHIRYMLGIYVTADNDNGLYLSSRILIKNTKNKVQSIDGGNGSTQLKQA